MCHLLKFHIMNSLVKKWKKKKVIFFWDQEEQAQGEREMRFASQRIFCVYKANLLLTPKFFILELI